MYGLYFSQMMTAVFMFFIFHLEFRIYQFVNVMNDLYVNKEQGKLNLNINSYQHH